MTVDRSIDLPDDDRPPVRVDQRWDAHIRSWTTTWIAAEGGQTGSAAFSGNRADAAADKAQYERVLAERKPADEGIAL